MNKVEEFKAYRQQMNEKILQDGDKVIKRIYSLDSMAYSKGQLDVRSKELIGLTCSLVLRCDDCVKYHLEHCLKTGLTPSQIIEAMSVATVVGGTIVIPHLRRAYEYLGELTASQE
jgi:AhpD family alkylhydroperoxidase